MAHWLTLEQAIEGIRQGTGRGIKIAVVDSGVEIAHPDLKGLQLRDDLAVIEEDIALKVGSGGGLDLYGHGTAIASIVHQVAPEAQIGSFRVLGERLQSRTAIIREGVRLALDRGYQVLNCSFGCPGEQQYVMKYKDWVDEAYLKGVHVVAACNNYDFAVPEWPGYFTSVVTVNMATGPTSEAFYYRPGSLVEFAALGVDVDVAWKGGLRRTVSGSSFATPRVAALLARLLSVHPGLPPIQAKAILHQLAMPWSAAVAARNACG